MEEDFDEIAEGRLEWSKMLKAFYDPFHTQVEHAIGQERVNTERPLGKHPTSGKPVLARMGRYGPLVQIGSAEDPEKQFASIPSGKSIETITLEEALQAFMLPRSLGKWEGEEVLASTGRFGPYVKYKSLYISIKNDSGLDPFSITLEDAIPMIQQKMEFEKNKYINAFEYEKEKIQILNGPYGPYIKYKKKNYKIPKGGKDATDLTLEDALEIIETKGRGA